MLVDNGKLRLFVVGELSGDPDKWGEWGERTLVIANDEQEAASLAEAGTDAVTEVAFVRPCALMTDKGRSGLFSSC
jgi:hypothetical protein